MHYRYTGVAGGRLPSWGTKAHGLTESLRAPTRNRYFYGKLLDDEAYEAACSDAHRPEDAEIVEEAIEVLTKRVGLPETERLLGAGPRGILGLR